MWTKPNYAMTSLHRFRVLKYMLPLSEYTSITPPAPSATGETEYTTSITNIKFFVAVCSYHGTPVQIQRILSHWLSLWHWQSSAVGSTRSPHDPRQMSPVVKQWVLPILVSGLHVLLRVFQVPDAKVLQPPVPFVLHSAQRLDMLVSCIFKTDIKSIHGNSSSPYFKCDVIKQNEPKLADINF